MRFENSIDRTKGETPEPETLGYAHCGVFLMSAFSIAAMVLAIQIGRRLGLRFGAWNSFLQAACVFLIIVGIVSHFLVEIERFPPAFLEF